VSLPLGAAAWVYDVKQLAVSHQAALPIQLRHIHNIWYTYITVIMVSKSKQTYDKKTTETKDKLLEMAATQKITWETYEELATRSFVPFLRKHK
jgi:hypothetical protein